MHSLVVILLISLIKSSFQNLFSIVADDEFCKQSYFQDTVLHQYSKRPRKVPLILGMPHSGVTWVRDIVEQHVRVPTGSLGLMNGSMDGAMLSLFPKGDFCSSRASALGCEHPHMVRIVNRGTIAFKYKAQERYCRNDGVYSFHTVILLIRNPYDSILRGYQLLNPDSSLQFSDQKWRSYALQASAHYQKSWEQLEGVVKEMGSKLFLLRYEHMLDQSKFIDILNALVVFLDRAPKTQDMLDRKLRVISCLDKYPMRKMRDELNISHFRGEPYNDATLVNAMASNLQSYLSTFGYSKDPPVYSDFRSNDANNFLTASTSTMNMCDYLNQSIAYADESITNAGPPPVLLTFPGAGGNWVRKIIEMTSGLHSGSLGLESGLIDQNMKDQFAGEDFCGRRFSVIHSSDVKFISVSNGVLKLTNRAHRAKCRKGVVYEFGRAIIMVRNPYEALISSYRSHLKSTSEFIIMSNDWPAFVKEAFDAYSDAWSSVLSKLVTFPKNKVFIVKYEDLKDSSKRMDTIKALNTFLGATNGFISADSALQIAREKCAFMLSESENLDDNEYSLPPFSNSLVLKYAMKSLESFNNAFGYPMEPPASLYQIQNASLTGEMTTAPSDASSIMACFDQYARVSFAPSQTVRKDVPPLLLSMPGSGIIWMRKMAELATGWYTGSLGLSNGGIDPTMKEIFPGEDYCGRRFAVINCPDIQHISATDKSIGFNVKAIRQKCRRGVIHEFPRVVLLVRNPYDSFIAAHRTSLPLSMRHKPLAMKDDWDDLVSDLGLKYNQTWNMVLSVVTRYPKERLLIVRYEDMIVPRLRQEIMRNISMFVRSHSTSEVDAESISRASCSSILSSFSDLDDLDGAEYALPPFDETVVAELSPLVKSYAQAFNYPSTPPLKLVGNRKVVGGATPIVLSTLWNYSKPLAEYSPALILDGSVPALEASNLCAQHFGHRRFWLIPKQTPVLLSYPGSGNTWVRQLIEYSTGIFSGSTDCSDGVLQEEFIGEKYCSKETSVIKAHPNHMELTESGLTRLVLPFQEKKCLKGGIKTFDKYVLLVRDPYRAILAEYNREVTQSHIGRVTVSEFLASKWHAILTEEAKYVDQYWTSLVYPLVSNHQNILLVRFEDLVNQQKREGALQKMINFIDPSTRVTLERIRCAFIQADSSHAHRSYSINSVNASYVYSNASFVDELWEKLRGFSEYMGYKKYV